MHFVYFCRKLFNKLIGDALRTGGMEVAATVLNHLDSKQDAAICSLDVMRDSLQLRLKTDTQRQVKACGELLVATTSLSGTTGRLNTSATTLTEATRALEAAAQVLKEAVSVAQSFQPSAQAAPVGIHVHGGNEMLSPLCTCEYLYDVRMCSTHRLRRYTCSRRE